ncbi:MAG: hypothetical protein P5680_14085 [Limnospira sp. PMC 737.11]|uniref:Uncharacterized protein n=1 Tax=Limnospira fusiformis PMC 851.14 TaxID=2219512 RepID=A0ABU9EP24_LIMFS|nr:hypothetical protein [Limnospira sp. PMC 737.11]MDT9275722.1 hypothetical protein [Limnospira sp. PMC 737.11]
MSNPTNSPVRGRKRELDVATALHSGSQSNPTNSPVRGRKLCYAGDKQVAFKSPKVQPYQFPRQGTETMQVFKLLLRQPWMSNPTNSPVRGRKHQC